MLVARHVFEAQLLQRGYRAGIDERAGILDDLPQRLTTAFEFAAWLILASSMSVAFQQDWIQWATLGLVYVNELGSIIGNYLCTKDIEFSLLGFLRAVLVFIGRWIGNKLGIVTDDVTFDDVLKPAKGRKRDKSGRFVKE